jgi:hypothetical protein
VRFYLGTHEPSWLWNPAIRGVPLFVAHPRLTRLRSLRRASSPWALDSGGYSELRKYGEWRTTAREYVEAVARYDREIGHLEWAAPQDWMCEPWMIHGGRGAPGTHLTGGEHQRRTVANFLECRALWPEFSDGSCPIMPAVQGGDGYPHTACVELYTANGVDLAAYPVVGVGTLCRVQATAEVVDIIGSLTGLPLHGFGVKKTGLAAVCDQLVSADSLAWSFDARYTPVRLAGHAHTKCQNCLEWALKWRSTLPGIE